MKFTQEQIEAPKKLAIFIVQEGNLTTTDYVGDKSLLNHIYQKAMDEARAHFTFCNTKKPPTSSKESF